MLHLLIIQLINTAHKLGMGLITTSNIAPSLLCMYVATEKCNTWLDRIMGQGLTECNQFAAFRRDQGVHGKRGYITISVHAGFYTFCTRGVALKAWTEVRLSSQMAHASVWEERLGEGAT